MGRGFGAALEGTARGTLVGSPKSDSMLQHPKVLRAFSGPMASQRLMKSALGMARDSQSKAKGIVYLNTCGASKFVREEAALPSSSLWARRLQPGLADNVHLTNRADHFFVLRGARGQAAAVVEMKLIAGIGQVHRAIPHIGLPCDGVPVSAKMGIGPEECKPVPQPLIPNRAALLQFPVGGHAEKIQ